MLGLKMGPVAGGHLVCLQLWITAVEIYSQQWEKNAHMATINYEKIIEGKLVRCKY